MMLAEQVWRLVDSYGEAHEDFETLVLALQYGGREFMVSVTGKQTLLVRDAINAMRAASAHMLSIVGAELPQGARKPVPGELEAPKTCQ